MNRKNCARLLSRVGGAAAAAVLLMGFVGVGGCSGSLGIMDESDPQPTGLNADVGMGMNDCVESDYAWESSLPDASLDAAHRGGGWDGLASAPDVVEPPADSSAEVSFPGGPPPGPGNPGDCTLDCENMQCGPDGCGGSCGWCSAQTSCQEGACVEVEGCTPECAGKMIGEDDLCGGVCSGGGFGIGLKPGGAQDVGYFRMLVADGQVPEPDLFPIEGFLNEHDTPLPAPDYSMLVTLHAFLGLFYDPEVGEPLISMQLGLNSGLDPAVIEDTHLNLVAVVDASGSMGEAGKMEFVREGLVLMLESLDDNDTLSIVTYESSATTVMGPTLVLEVNKPMIEDVINNISPGGSTNLHAGMVMGYELAMKNITNSEAVHRIMLLSDGLVTAGISNTDLILADSAVFTDEGIGITTIGVGVDFNFDLMYELANQGNGNFYFLDEGSKLIEVFQHEIEYLLTPVADNLKISFSLPKGFFVEDIYGFDFKEEGGEVVLLGPSPQYDVAPPNDNPPPGGGDGPDVAVSTLFASKKNGLLMVKIGADSHDIFDAWEALDFAEVTYSYELVNNGKTETASKTVALGSLSYFAEDDPDSGLAYFTGPIMQRNFCILRAALAMKQACTLFNQDSPDINGAVVEIADASTFCTGINLQLEDPAIDDDLEFMEQLKDNMCAIMDCTVAF